MVKRTVLMAVIVLAATHGCSTEREAPERERSTQSATRTVPYLTDTQQVGLVEQIQRLLPDVSMDAARVSEAMRSTCVAMLDEVPNLERVAASRLTGGLRTDLSEETVIALMRIARAQEWCHR